VLGGEGVVRLVRYGGKQLDGVQVIYRGCAGDDARKRKLREGLGRELAVKSPDVDVPYETWNDSSLVHFVADPNDGTCTLTVAGPRFGKAFAAALMAAASATWARRPVRASGSGHFVRVFDKADIVNND
jgi:hypothetical protein